MGAATGSITDDAAGLAPDDREYARSLGSRLRAVRSQQRLSLHGVERKSGGKWKAVVVGSYERGDRAVSVARLAELAEFYGVPISELLPNEDGSPISRIDNNAKIVLDRLGVAHQWRSLLRRHPLQLLQIQHDLGVVVDAAAR